MHHDLDSRFAQTIDLRRDRVLQFAALEFLEHGYEYTNLDGIAASAHVSKRTIYELFGSKENLFRIILRSATTEMVETVDMNFDVDAPPEEELTRFGAKYMSAMMQPVFGGPPYYQIARLVIDATVRFPEIAYGVADLVKTPQRQVRSYIEKLVTAGKLQAADIDLATQLFIQLMFFTEKAIFDALTLPEPSIIEASARRRVRLFLFGCAQNQQAGTLTAPVG